MQAAGKERHPNYKRFFKFQKNWYNTSYWYCKFKRSSVKYLTKFRIHFVSYTRRKDYEDVVRWDSKIQLFKTRIFRRNRYIFVININSCRRSFWISSKLMMSKCRSWWCWKTKLNLVLVFKIKHLRIAQRFELHRLGLWFPLPT